MAKPDLRIVLCAPRGFCAGVVRAIDVVERALALYGAPVYVRHEIVHNRYVVEALKKKRRIRRRRSSFPPMACRKACRRKPKRAASSQSTPPARWSPRYIARRKFIS